MGANNLHSRPRPPPRLIHRVIGKSELRKNAREKLRALTPADFGRKSALLCERLLASPSWQAANVVALFAAQPSEPDLEPLWRERGGKTLCYPRVNGVSLDFLAVDSPAVLETSRWQLREPIHDETKIVAPERFDLIFVPGLAFTPAGVRLGRGGGFYDRLLANPNLRAVKIGVCFSVQIFDEIPREPHDCTVDFVITECAPP